MRTHSKLKGLAIYHTENYIDGYLTRYDLSLNGAEI